MLNPYFREKIETWVGDFSESSRYAALPPGVREYASQILVAFLSRACEEGDTDPDSVTEKSLRCGLLEGVRPLALPESVKSDVPLLCRSFLEELEDQGRLGGGAALGSYIGALRTAYLEKATERPRPIVSKTSKIGRNDPCPCGSGKKYKKCCQNLLGKP